jgi:hypothetical protein
MSRLTCSGRWIPRRGAWQLVARRARRRHLATVSLVAHGWLVELASGERAGPYGDLELARTSAELRAARAEGTLQ